MSSARSKPSSLLHVADLGFVGHAAEGDGCPVFELERRDFVELCFGPRESATLTALLNSLRRNSFPRRGNGDPQELKRRLSFSDLTARLKSCPSQNLYEP
jgi:hypothetical protein